MEPKMKGRADNRKIAAIEEKAATTINHPLLNKWLTAEIINDLPDATAQAIADLIEATVKRQKREVKAHTYYEFYGGGGTVMTGMIEELRTLLKAGEKGVNSDEQ